MYKDITFRYEIINDIHHIEKLAPDLEDLKQKDIRLLE